MKITTKISLDLREPRNAVRIKAVQNDANSRAIEARLYDGGIAWVAPNGVTAAMGFRKPDHTGGIYDKLPDGSNAVTIDGEVVTVILAPQVLTVAGIVNAVIILNDTNMNQLSTFPFQICVEKNPAAGLVVSDNYINVVNIIGDLNKLVTSDKSSLVAAINEIARSNGGTISNEQIAQAVADYLAENPIEENYPTTTEITDESTDEEVPTAAAVWEYVRQHSGGSGTLYVTISNGMCSHTAAEIYEAVSNGLSVFAIDADETILTCSLSAPTESVFTFTSFAGSATDLLMYLNVVRIDGTGKIVSEIRNVKELVPYSGTAAIGKYLKRGKNGIVWAELPAAASITINGGGPDENGNFIVDADPKGTAEAAISEHNTDTAAHNDLRLELKALANRVAAFLDSDDVTLDQLSELIAGINSNKTLIESVATGKVSVTDIIDNLTTNVANKPLSAAQGVVLKGLIDTLSNSLSGYQPKGDYALRSEIPTKVSQLTNDSGFITRAAQDLVNYYRKSETYSREEIDQKVSAIPKFTIAPVSALPAADISETTIYLLPGGDGSDLYTEYIYADGKWEILGSQRVDLTGYAKETWVIGKLAEYQPKGDYALRRELPKAVYVTFTDNGDGTGTADKTWAEIQAAYENGSTIIGSINTAGVAGVIIGVCNINSDHVMLANISTDAKIWAAMLDSTDTVMVASVDVIPAMLPNPNALTFTGAASGSYDGSAAKTVNIPTVPAALKNPKALTVDGVAYDGSTAVDITDTINAMVDAKLQPETELVLSDNLFDKSAAVTGSNWYHSSSGPSLVASTIGFYAYVPLRGAGTYRTILWWSFHGEAYALRVPILKEDNSFLQNVTGTLKKIDDTFGYLEFTVTDDMIANGAAVYAYGGMTSNLDTLMIVKDREYPSEYIPYGYIEVEAEGDTEAGAANILSGKTAVFLGDSICAGTTVGDDSEYYGYGWAGLIGEGNAMTWKNYGRNGGTITPLSSVDTARWVPTQADSAFAAYPNADYVIFEGGCNDADTMKDALLGEISSDYATFDETTFSGAFESLVLKLLTNFPTAKIGYVIPQKMYAVNDHSAAGHVHRRFFDRAIAICEKWGIPHVDLWEGNPLNPKLSTASTFYTDGQHLTLAGYQRITPQIEAFMRSL